MKLIPDDAFIQAIKNETGSGFVNKLIGWVS